jgi:hypothetical protein
METHDHELIMKFIESDKKLKRLYQQHIKLEDLLDTMSKRRFLSDDDQMLQQRLKKEKLIGVEQMLSLIRTKNTEDVQPMAG